MAVLTHQQIAQLVNNKVASNQPLATSQKSVLQSSTAIGIDTSSTPFRTSSNQSSTPVTTTTPTIKGNTIAVSTPGSSAVQNLLYYNQFPEEAVAKAQANASNNRMDALYATTYNTLVKGPQEAAQSLSERYIDGRSIREINPAMVAAKVLTNIAAGGAGVLAQIPAIAYGINQHFTQQWTGNNLVGQKGTQTLTQETIPAMVESAQTDPLAFGSQIAGGALVSGGLAKGASLLKVKKPSATLKVSSGTKAVKAATTTALKEAISKIDDPSAGLSAKQIASTALTDKNALSAIPGEITHTLTKKEIKLRNSVGDALKTTSATKHNEILAISQQTKQKNASAPVTVNVADVQTVYTGANQNSGFIVRIKQPTTGKKSTITEKFISAKPKDMSKRAGKQIVTALNSKNKPTVSYSAGPNQREIILQWDPSQQVYMKLKENGAGRYDYIGDITEKQISQLEKLDTNTGSQAKNREYAILSEPGYVRPDAGKFSIPYKNEYAFNIVISKGKGNKYKYTLVDQIFHKNDSFPTEIKGDIAGKLIDSIEDGRDIQLLSAGERWEQYKSTRQGQRAVAYLYDPAEYGATVFTGTQSQWGVNPFVTPQTAGPRMLQKYGLTPMQRSLRQERLTWESNPQATRILHGIESQEHTLPDGITNTKVIPGNSININVKDTIHTVSKDVFTTMNKHGARPKANGRSVTPSTVNVKAAPTVKARTAPKTNQKNASQPQQTAQAGAGIGLSTATLAGTTAGVIAVPLATATVTGQAATAVIEGTIPLPAVIPTTETISQVLDTATANSVSTATSESTAKSTSTTASDTIADSTARSDSTATTYDMSTPSAIPIAVSTALAIAGAGASSNGRNSTRKQTTKKTTENKVRRLRTPVKKTEKKTKKRIRLNLNTKADPRRKVTKTKKARKYVQVENYIPWLEEEEEITKKWYMVDAKLMRTKQKITSAIKKAIEAYNTSATKYNGARKKLLSIIRTAGRTAKGKKAAEQLRKLYRDVKVKKARVTKAVKARK